MNLFQINSIFFSIANEIMNADGEISDDLYNELLGIEQDRDDKLTDICKFIKYLGGNNDMIDDEIERLKTLKARNDNMTKRLKQSIIDTLKLHNLTGKSGNYSHKLPLYSIWTTGHESVEIDEVKLQDYHPIDGTKVSPFITYNLIGDLDADSMRGILEMVEITSNNIVSKVDKKELKQFMKETGQTGEVVEIQEGSIDEILASGDDLPSPLKKEDIIDFAKITKSESLTIR